MTVGAGPARRVIRADGAPTGVDVVLPVLDEVEAIPWVLARVPLGYRPIVVDNGSTDGSGEVARRLGATVVGEAQRGFGAACYAGLTAATAPLVAFMDCDGSLDPRDLVPLVRLVEEGVADLAIGARRAERAAWPLHARLANRWLAREVRRRARCALSDLGPMRVAGRAALLELGLADRRSGWPLEMVLRAGADGWQIRELPVPYRARTGRSKVTGTLGGTLRAVHDMHRELRRHPV
jgi:glycosyltransferase involved in cell wall biosynthesis